jgi:hypothetical protein
LAFAISSHQDVDILSITFVSIEVYTPVIHLLKRNSDNITIGLYYSVLGCLASTPDQNIGHTQQDTDPDKAPQGIEACLGRHEHCVGLRFSLPVVIQDGRLILS